MIGKMAHCFDPGLSHIQLLISLFPFQFFKKKKTERKEQKRETGKARSDLSLRYGFMPKELNHTENSRYGFRPKKVLVPKSRFAFAREFPSRLLEPKRQKAQSFESLLDKKNSPNETQSVRGIIQNLVGFSASSIA
jgi:hypothetical protein